MAGLLTASRVAQTHDPRSLDPESWPIATGTLPFPGVRADGGLVQLLGATEWEATLAEVARAGFGLVELTDTWLRPGDLSPLELTDLGAAVRRTGMQVGAVALIRRSILDPRHGAENLAYSHRSIDAAAALGARIVSVGLHEALLPAQRDALWFWTQDGAHNDPGDGRAWKAAVAGFRELGRHAADSGLLLTLEMYEDTFLGTADSAVRLVEEVGMPEVGLNADTGNLIRLHRPIESWREVLSTVLPYTNYWHLKNYARDEDPVTGQVHAVPTSLELGLIDYRWAVRQARDAGFAGILTCEQYGGDGLSVSATNARYLRTVLPLPVAEGGR
jgi:sugar phosphate isomerase/epimerase